MKYAIFPDGKKYVAQNVETWSDDGTTTLTIVGVSALSHTYIASDLPTLEYIVAQWEQFMSQPGDVSVTLSNPPVATISSIEWSSDGVTYNALPIPAGVPYTLKITGTGLAAANFAELSNSTNAPVQSTTDTVFITQFFLAGSAGGPYDCGVYDVNSALIVVDAASITFV